MGIPFRTSLLTTALLAATWCEPVFSADFGKKPRAISAAQPEFHYRRTTSVAGHDRDRETLIATRTALHADHAPGAVTILPGVDMERRGARTVLDALDMTPGWNTAGRIFVRGVGDLSVSTKLKIMLNGIPMNPETCGRTFIANIPIESVRRIEILRSPASTIHGDGTHLGLVNIVTQDAFNRIFLRSGSFDTGGGGAHLFFARPSDRFALSLNASRLRQGPTDIVAGRDRLHGASLEEMSHAPGPVNDSRKLSNTILSMTFRDITLLGQRFRYNQGPSFGFGDVLPPPDGRGTERQETDTVDLKWRVDASSRHSVDLYWGWRRSVREIAGEHLHPPSGVAGYERGMLFGPRYEERANRSGMEVHLTFPEKHTFLLGVEYNHAELADARFEGNIDPYSLAPMDEIRRFDGCESWLTGCRTRKTFSLLVQDRYRLLDRLTLTGGMRYDRREEFNERWSPRLAAVYEITERHLLKAQYAEAFRAPAFLETSIRPNPIVQGNPDLKMEQARTSELGYVFMGEALEMRLTVFRSEVGDMIVVRENEYRNLAEARSRGAEIEISGKRFGVLDVDAAVSFISAKDASTGRTVPGSSRWLGNVGVQYPFRRDYTLALWYRYAGKRYRAPDDDRPALKARGRLDGSVSVDRFLMNGLTLRLGVRNLLNEDLRTPSAFGGYPDDYPEAGREWWIQATMTF